MNTQNFQCGDNVLIVDKASKFFGRVAIVETVICGVYSFKLDDERISFSEVIKLPEFSKVTTVVTLCAWCEKTKLDEKLRAAGFVVSHGVCPSCKSQFLKGD